MVLSDAPILSIIAVGTGGLSDEDLFEIKSEINYEGSPSDSSTATVSTISSRHSSSKLNLQSQGKVKTEECQVQKKSKGISLQLLSDESTDELEDFEPVSHSSCTKRKRSAIRHYIPLMPRKKRKLSRPRPRYLSSDTTDDLDGDRKPDVKTENESEHGELGSHQPTVQYSTSAPKVDPIDIVGQPKEPVSVKVEQKMHWGLSPSPTSTGKTLRLKKVSKKNRFMEIESASRKILAQQATLSDDVHPKEDTRAFPGASSSESEIQIMPGDELLNDFENDAARESEDSPVIKRKRQVRKQLLSSSSMKSSDESQETNLKGRKGDSVDKVRDWLESSSEGNASDVIAKSDDHTEDICLPYSLASPAMPSRMPQDGIIHDTCHNQSHLETQPEPATSTSTQEQAQTSITEESLGPAVDTLSPNSTSSSDSSLPPILWEQDVGRDKVKSKRKRRQAEIKECTDVSHVAKQSSVISTAETQQQSLAVVDYGQPSVHDISETRELHGKSGTSSSTVTPIHSSPKKIKLKEISLSVSRIKTTSPIHKPTIGSSESKVTVSHIDVPEDMEVSPPLYEEDVTSEQSDLEYKALSEVAATKEPSHSVNSSSAKEKSLETSNLTGSGDKQQFASQSPPQKSLKHQTKKVKSARRVIFTEVPGMKYSSKKSILKSNLDVQLPHPPSGTLRSTLPKTRLSGTSDSLLKHKGPSTFSNSSHIDV